MKSFGKVLTIAMLAVGCGLVAASKASACPAHAMTLPAVIDTGAVIDNSIVQPAVIDTSLTTPAVIDNRLTQPALIDNGCNTRGSMVDTTLVQPAVIDNAYGVPACGVRNVGLFGRRHLLNLNTPFFGVHLF